MYNDPRKERPREGLIFLFQKHISRKKNGSLSVSKTLSHFPTKKQRHFSAASEFAIDQQARKRIRVGCTGGAREYDRQTWAIDEGRHAGKRITASVAIIAGVAAGGVAAAADQNSLVANTAIDGPVLVFDWPAIEVGVGSYESIQGAGSRKA
jgi:hypothetical protein